MTNLGKIVSVVLALVIVGALYGAYQYPKAQIQVIAGSPAGSSFTNAKAAGQQITLGTTTAYSQLNSDASDRTITAVDVMLKNATATSTTYNIACATSTSPSGFNGNTNYILNTSLATTTFGTIINAGTYVASSSPGITGTTTASVLVPMSNTFVRNWATGSYLDCQVTTADSYNAFNSTTNGIIYFSYRGQ